MSEDRRGAGSFDPRTWLESGHDAPPPPAADPAASDGGTSFDPRSWADGGERSAPPPEAPTADPLPQARRSHAKALAGGAGLVLVACGFGAARLGQGDAPVLSAVTDAAPAAAVAPDVRSASRRTLVISGPAALPPTLIQAGVPAIEVTRIAADALGRLGSAPGEIRLVVDLVDQGGEMRLTRLEATRDDGSGAVLTATAGGFRGETLAAKLTTVIRSARGEMDATSFYSSAVAAGINDTLISEIAKAFSFDFDFQREIAPGDVFEAAWEQRTNPAGEPVGPPQLVYAQMVTAAKSKALYRYLAPGETEPGWYDGNGRSTVRALMRTPVDGARITSNFGYRVHPIQGYRKLHKGTDFGAPTGTPIFAAGNGVVEVAGPRGCAGNFFVIRHDNGWQTRYMHLSAYAGGMAPGVRVSQGQRIGDVGTTGCSTGPHLHFEVWIDNQPVDSMSIDTGSGKTLEGDALAAFRRERDRIDVSRARPPA